MGYQEEKKLVRNYYDAMEKASPDEAERVLARFTSEDYNWKGVYPFREQNGAGAAAEVFWTPLKKSLKHMQRRMDIFLGGENEIDGDRWVMSMGQFMGLFDEDFLGIRHTRKMQHLRYAEFNCVQDGKITKTGLFVDLIRSKSYAAADRTVFCLSRTEGSQRFAV